MFKLIPQAKYIATTPSKDKQEIIFLLLMFTVIDQQFSWTHQKQNKNQTKFAICDLSYFMRKGCSDSLKQIL